MPRAYSYIRFSTPEQLKGHSLSRQLALSRDYLQLHPELELDESLTFRDLGVSAFDRSNLAKGGQLRAFLDAVELGTVPPGSYLLVESLDRISRAEITDALEIFMGILNRGITVVTLADGMEYSKDKANRQFTDLIISITVMSRAHEESLTKSNRLKAAWESKRQNHEHRKLTAMCPAWLRMSKDKSAYETIPEKEAIVREIIQLTLSGVGKGAIAKRFNQKGIRSIGSRGRQHTWFPSYVTKILKSRALIGEFQPYRMLNGKRVAAGDPIPDYFPRILVDDEFVVLQQLIEGRANKRGGSRGKAFANLFTGLLRCGYCGSTMVYVNKGDDKRGKRTQEAGRFLVCSSAKRGAGCRHIPWTYSEFERSLLEHARGLDFAAFVKAKDAFESSSKRILDEITVQRAKLEDLQQRRDRLIDALEGADEKPVGVLERISEYERQIGAIQVSLGQLDAELKSAQGKAQVSESAVTALHDLLGRLENLSGDDLYLLRARLNEHLRRLLHYIRVFAGGTIDTAEEIDVMKYQLLSSGRYSKKDVNEYVAEFMTLVPKKEDRFILIRNVSDQVQVLSPEHDIPDILNATSETPELVREYARLQRYRRASRVIESN